jgi:excisionase family DNA binding protein
MDDYKNRNYLSAVEVAKYLGLTVKDVHDLVEKGILRAFKSASGQYRFRLSDIRELESK